MISISIDLWGTLIKSSPTFQEKKYKLFQKFFNNTIEEITVACNDTKLELNNIIESIGWQPTYEMIWNHLKNKLYPTSNWPITTIIHDYNELVIKYPPIIYSVETTLILNKLYLLGPLYLSSNTMFLTSDILLMKNVLPFNRRLFDKFLFSDEQKVAKPNPIMYSNSNYHIGDNEKTDLIGAKKAGSIPFIINSNDKTIYDAYHFIRSQRNI